ncbi:MAG: PKD domain-containing protein, partial [Solirubrobacteraceae bacterium]
LWGVFLGVVVGLLPSPGVFPRGAALPPSSPRVIDGPNAQILGLSGLSVARDGTGGLVYVKQVSGVAHVFVARLVRGTFVAPQQVDRSLGGPSSQPVIAAGDGGLLLIAFINAGQLYVVDRASTSSSYSAPRDLYGGAASPSLQLTPSGKGYLAFTAAGAGGHDVRSAYYHARRWALESTPLDAVPARDAGTGAGRPRVAAAGDGVGIVVWGEAGHVYSRRVWGTSPSVVYEQADVPSLPGASEVAAVYPDVGAGGDSSYVNVVFDELLFDGSRTQSRVLMRRLVGSQYEAVTPSDGLFRGASGGADQPRIAIGEYGRGFVTSARDDSNQLFATLLGYHGASVGQVRVDSRPNATPPYAVPATTGLYSYVIAWQHDPGPGGSAEIRARAFNGSGFGPELVLSSASRGPTDAAYGLFAGGDIAGDAVIAWVQGTGGSVQIVATQLYQPPGGVRPMSAREYSRGPHPVLRWTPSRERFGAVDYFVSVDGVGVGQSATTSLRVPRALSEGPHPWQVTAINQGGLESASRIGTVWVDTVRPVVRVTLGAARQARSPLQIFVSYTDPPRRGSPAGVASGIATGWVNWGDGSIVPISQRASHAYRASGRYRLTVTVADQAGNTTTRTRSVRIARAHR